MMHGMTKDKLSHVFLCVCFHLGMYWSNLLVRRCKMGHIHHFVIRSYLARWWAAVPMASTACTAIFGEGLIYGAVVDKSVMRTGDDRGKSPNSFLLAKTTCARFQTPSRNQPLYGTVCRFTQTEYTPPFEFGHGIIVSSVLGPRLRFATYSCETVSSE